ncbi:MAG: serine/threonine-protein kinase [Myxococcota bacterium]
MLQPLGEGGAATVHLCWDRELGVERAIKLRRMTNSQRHAEGMQRLEDEARVMARLKHDHVLPVFEMGQEAGWQWVVMELARGGSLRDQLDDGPLSPKHAIDVVIAVLEAAQAAHDMGVVHRDIKPHNVLISEEGKPMLADWGIARLDERALTLTSTGVAMGSMSYMAPEQRLDAHDVDATADVYATGALLYNLVTCASPVDLFLAPDSSPRWEDVPEDLLPVLRRACSKKPVDRYQTADEFGAALKLLVGTASTTALKTGPMGADGSPLQDTGSDRTLAAGEAPSPPSPRWPWWVAGALVVLSVLLVGVLLVPGVIPTAQTITLNAEPVEDAPVDEPGRLAPELQAPSNGATTQPTPPKAPTETPAVRPTPPPADPPADPPAATEPEPPADDATTLPIHGTWRGVFEGQVARLRLRGGPSRLRGSLDVSGSVATVTGRFAPSSNTATITVQGQETTGGAWKLQLDGDRLKGSAHIESTGDLLSVSFRRVPIR